MPANVNNKDTLRMSHAVLRTRLLAKRKLEEARLANVREALRRIDRELAALDRERMRPSRQKSDAAMMAERGARAAKQFASTATR